VTLVLKGSEVRKLAVMDSIEITILRTGAATAAAAKHLARPDSSTVTVCGCGLQGRIQLRALSRVLPLAHAFAAGLRAAVSGSDVCVTCTPSRAPFLERAFLRPGTFVAAVGADSPDKQELDPAILASAKVVADVLDQCAAIGEIHHALAAGRIARADVHAELGEVVAGRKPGRTSAAEITVFDSTGTALQDVAAAALVYEKAARIGAGTPIALEA